ncbi:MAG: prolipoprotein diacylglyceryl transferase [Bacilli bacterium]
MNPNIISTSYFNITWYSVFIIIGIILASIFIVKESYKFGIDKTFMVNLIFWCVIFGFLGARLYYVAFQWEYYAANPIEILKVWHGGLAMHGGLIFGFFTILIYCKKYKVSVLRVLDVAVPFVLIAQAIGRWGNFFNSEAYGPVTSLETLHKLFIPSAVINGMLIDGLYRVPTFYFESLWCVLGAIFILTIRHYKYIRLGQQVGTYLMWYSVGRFVIESLRTDSLMLGSFKIAQVVSIILFFAGFILIMIQSKKPALNDLYNTKDKEKVKNF